MTGIIYSVTNKTNCMTYVGQTIYSLQKRKRKHFNSACNKKDNSMFHNAIRKYGEDNFIWDVIATYEHTDIQKLKSMLNKVEIYYINAYDTFYDGYNLTEGGGGIVGWNHTEEANQKNREAHLGEKNPCFGRTGEKNPMYGMTGEKAPNFGRTGEKNPMYGMTGEKNPMYGMTGEKSPRYGKPGWNKGMNKEEMEFYSANKKTNNGKIITGD